MRNRAAVVIVKDNKLALIKRVKGNQTYYVFPGGGIECGESPIEAAKREAYEELGVTVTILDLLTMVHYEGTQYFYGADILDGSFGTGHGIEFQIGEGSYDAVWVDLSQIGKLSIYPEEVVKKIQL